MNLEPARQQEVEGLAASLVACGVDRFFHYLGGLLWKGGLRRNRLVHAIRGEKTTTGFRKRRSHHRTVSQNLVVRPQTLTQPDPLDLPVRVEPLFDVG
ncbi:hypothetical protein ACFYS7_21705 [Streptomyces avermitilis]|uniref:hypothetical protein n=1 Tax=Streptomyces avermitilis TaxID=33903 RepID=UPI00368B1E26